MEKADEIYVVGHRALVDSSATRVLQKQGFTNLAELTNAELELTDESAIAAFFSKEKPDYVVLVAAKSGGHYFQQLLPG